MLTEPRNVKIAMLAATSLLSAAAALAPVHANELDPAAFPTVVEAPVVAHAADQVAAHGDHDSKLGQRAALAAIGLGALGWLVRLLGPRKVLKAVEKTAQATVNASASAARAAGRAMRSPLRMLGLMAGLVLFALTGVGLYDIEWIGGLVAGAALVGVAAFSAARARGAMQLLPARIKTKQRVNEN